MKYWYYTYSCINKNTLENNIICGCVKYESSYFKILSLLRELEQDPYYFDIKITFFSEISCEEFEELEGLL